MPYSAGVFSRLYNWVNDRDAAIKILASRMDAEMDGFATGLSTCILKDGTQTVTANIPMATYKFTGLGAGTGAGDSVRYEQVVLLSAGANQTITRSVTGTALTLESTADGSTTGGPDLVLFRNGANSEDGDLGGSIYFDHDDSGGTQTNFARIHMVADDFTDTTEDGSLHFSVMTAGTLADELTLDGSALFPTTDEGLTIGKAGNEFASGFFTNIELGNASDTTLARSSAGNVSIEGNVIYRAGGTDVPVTDGGTGASTAAAGARALLDGLGTTKGNILWYNTSWTVLAPP